MQHVSTLLDATECNIEALDRVARSDLVHVYMVQQVLPSCHILTISNTIFNVRPAYVVKRFSLFSVHAHHERNLTGRERQRRARSSKDYVPNHLQKSSMSL
jgi:hypothetical protein